MPTTILPKGQKKKLVRQFLNEEGVEATYSSAKKWFKKYHNLTLADATFYHVRRDMQLARKQQQPQPNIMKLVHEDIVADLTIIDVVQGAKELIDKLGKEDAKKLIDLLTM